MLIVNLLFFIIACLVLVQSNNYLIKSLAKISYFLKLTEFTIGFILVAIGTSLPEIFVGVMSALEGVPAFSVGNVIGSNILDLTLVIGIATILAKNINIESKIVRRDVIYMLVMTLLPVILLIDHYFWHMIGLFPNMTIGLSRLDGFLLLSAFVYYLYVLLKQEPKFSKVGDHISRKDAIKNMIIFLASLVLLLVSAHFVVQYAELLSIDLDLSPVLIGIFIISLGTSLPELVFETKAVLSGHQSMAIGDLIGSVISNSTVVLGITAIIMPISVNPAIYFSSTLFMLFSAFIFFTLAESDNKISWTEGVSLIMLYILFIIVETYLKNLRV